MGESKNLAVRKKQEVAREETTRPGRAFAPDVDIYETKDAIWLWADMPGVEESSLNVDLAGDVLTVQGEISTKDYGQLSPAYAEYYVGNYLRRFTVGRGVDSGRIQARMRDGVLEVELPKAESAKPRRIEVRAS